MGKLGAKVLVVDTLSHWALGDSDENSASDTLKAMDPLLRAAAEGMVDRVCGKLDEASCRGAIARLSVGTAAAQPTQDPACHTGGEHGGGAVWQVAVDPVEESGAYRVRPRIGW